ncbi:hypothetical protein Tco_1575045, partial [Tanacetum coccineum]
MDIVSIPTITTSKHSQVKKRISNKYSHLPGVLRRMCRRQGYMIQDMERKCVTPIKFWETHNKIDDILHKIVSQIAKNVTNDLIEYNLKPCIANTIIEDRDTFRSEVLALVSQEFNAHAPAIIEELFKSYVQSNVVHVHPTTTTSTKTDSSAALQYQLYFNLKRSLQDRANDIELWEALRQENVIDEYEVIPEDETPELIAEFQNVDKRVPTIFNCARIEATLKDTLSNQFRNTEENPNEPLRYLYNKDLFFLKYGNTEEMKYILSLHKIHAEEFLEPDLEEKLNRWVRKEFKTFNEDARLSIQHWKDSWNKRVYKQNQKKVRKNLEDYYTNYRITEVVRIVTDQPHGLDFMEQILMMRANDKPDCFSKADFKYLNKNDIEDLYYLCQSKK